MNRIPLIVPDASVVLKWVIQSGESDRDNALELREAWLSGRCDLVLPSLWFFEVSNILGMREAALAPQMMQALIDYGIEEEPPRAICGTALELVKRYKVTFYDAAYHAVAIVRSGTLITADDAYVRRASKAGRIGRLSAWTSFVPG